MAPPRRHWRPPFCPNPDCDSHQNPKAWRFKKKGFHGRLRGPRRVQRFLCQHCCRNFSSQTFSPTYWLRRTDYLPRLFFRAANSCSGLRQIAHELGVAHSTVQRQIERLGRHCMLFQETLRPRDEPKEPLVLDGLRTFENSQYWPYDLNLLIGASHYVYGFNDAELRRSGSMRPSQRRKRSRLEAAHGCPDPQATKNAVIELIARIVPKGASAVIESDEHQAYPHAFRALADRHIEHRSTSSKESRTAQNPLFPVNLADLLMRHGGANHKRETIAFSKRRQGAMYRAAIWQVWRNYVKSSSEKKRDAPPGVKIGVIPKRLTVSEILREREFPWRHVLSDWLGDLLLRADPDPAVGPLPGARSLVCDLAWISAARPGVPATETQSSLHNSTTELNRSRQRPAAPIPRPV